MKYLLACFYLLWLTCNKPSSEALRWAAAGIDNYTYTIKYNCFCTVERIGPHTIVVENNKVVSVNGNAYDPTKTGPMPTISELIELITASEARKPYKKTLRFDPTYGYPVEVFFDFDQNIADEELGFVITSFTKR